MQPFSRRPTHGALSSGIVLFLFAALIAASCSSDSADDQTGEAVGESVATTTTSTAPTVTAAPATTTSTTTPPDPAVVDSPAVEGPIVEPNTPNIPQPASALPDGYVLEEFFIEGEASSFELVGEATADGEWASEPAQAADYRTRILVRRPPAERFSGVVIVEWLNVTVVEAAPDWSYLSEEVGRAGHAYVMATVQANGVEGGEGILTVDVDEEQAQSAGAEGDEIDPSGLINIDPDRYGSLEHPGDAFAYDIYSQVGRAVRENPDLFFDGLQPEIVLGVGESQSASFLTTYVNAVHPRAQIYDSFMLHARTASAAALTGRFGEGIDDEETAEAFITSGVTIRDDLDTPVFIFQSETDLTLLGYVNARQDDSEKVHTWEIAGTAHSDAHLFRVFFKGPRDPNVATVIGCTNPINIGPQHETYQAAMSHLVTWTQDGTRPPPGARLEVLTPEGQLPVIARDELGRAIGGVRNPLVDVPVFVVTGDPPTSLENLTSAEGFDVCNLFGTTEGLDQGTLIELHGSAEQYLADFEASTAAAVDAGYLLPADAEQLLAEAVDDYAPLFG